LDAFISADAEDEEAGSEGQIVFLAILQSACALIRGAEAAGATNVDVAIERVDQLINKALNFAYGDSEMYDFVPSFAHSSDCPVLEEGTSVSAWRDWSTDRI
jgi:hypothetical protein